MSLKKDFDEVFRRAVKQGFRVERTNGGHVRLVSPDPNAPVIHAATSPSDRRAYRNLIGRLSRVGYRHAA